MLFAVPHYFQYPTLTPVFKDLLVDTASCNNWGLRFPTDPAGSNDVIVAVIDSGFDLAHPDIQGRLWVNAREKLGPDADGNGRCLKDAVPQTLAGARVLFKLDANFPGMVASSAVHFGMSSWHHDQYVCGQFKWHNVFALDDRKHGLSHAVQRR